MYSLHVEKMRQVFRKAPFKEISLIVLTAFLTTYGGNFIAYQYQDRLWERQAEESRRRDQLKVATDTFEELSGVMDKRIYRMNKLNEWLIDGTDQKMIEEQMHEYRSILYVWNDSFNKNKAIIKLYFGNDIASRFDYMHGFFKETGAILQEQYYLQPDERNADRLIEVGNRLGDLNNIALEINESMLSKIQAQEIGSI